MYCGHNAAVFSKEAKAGTEKGLQHLLGIIRFRYELKQVSGKFLNALLYGIKFDGSAKMNHKPTAWFLAKTYGVKT